jgi:hypothetical protein
MTDWTCELCGTRVLTGDTHYCASGQTLVYERPTPPTDADRIVAAIDRLTAAVERLAPQRLIVTGASPDDESIVVAARSLGIGLSEEDHS